MLTRYRHANQRVLSYSLGYGSVTSISGSVIVVTTFIVTVTTAVEVITHRLTFQAIEEASHSSGYLLELCSMMRLVACCIPKYVGLVVGQLNLTTLIMDNFMTSKYVIFGGGKMSLN